MFNFNLTRHPLPGSSTDPLRFSTDPLLFSRENARNQLDDKVRHLKEKVNLGAGQIEQQKILLIQAQDRAQEAIRVLLEARKTLLVTQQTFQTLSKEQAAAESELQAATTELQRLSSPFLCTTSSPLSLTVIPSAQQRPASSLPSIQEPQQKKQRVVDKQSLQKTQEKERSVLKEFFPIGTQVIYEGETRTIQEHEEESGYASIVLAPTKEGKGRTRQRRSNLAYLPTAGEFCLVRIAMRNCKTLCNSKYCKAQIKHASFKGKGKVSCTFIRLDDGKEISNIFEKLGSILPLSSETDPRLNAWLETVAVADPDHHRYSYTNTTFYQVK